MQFNDVAVNREQRYSLGVEEDSEKFYIAVPVDNGLVVYDEYYEIERATFDRYRVDLGSALDFVERCRRREMDDRLILKPGTKRGTAI